MRLVGSIDQQRFSARFAEARAAKGLSNAEIGDAVPPRRFSMVRVTRSRTGRTMGGIPSTAPAGTVGQP